MRTAEYWIKKLELQKHPEGGYFREVYRADEEIKPEYLPRRYVGARNFSTSIYLLLTNDQFSAFHRIKSDETWHFYYGSAVTIHMINEAGKYSAIKLGADAESGGVFQFAIPRVTWFAAEVNEPDSYTLVGCTVAPGFHYDDFELGKREILVNQFPVHKEIIKKFTR